MNFRPLISRRPVGNHICNNAPRRLLNNIFINFTFVFCPRIFTDRLFFPPPPRYLRSSINWSRVLFNLFGCIIPPNRRYCCRDLNQGQLCRHRESMCTHVYVCMYVLWKATRHYDYYYYYYMYNPKREK